MKPTKFIWLTDLHLVDAERPWPQNVDPRQRLRALLDDAFRNHTDADRLVLTGDLAQLGNRVAYRVLREELERIPVPYRLLVGNHDDLPALREVFPDVPVEDEFLQYMEDLNGIRAIYLDTRAAGGKHHGEICAARLSWLRTRLLEAETRPVMIFMHHPTVAIGVPALDRLRLVDSDQLGDMLRARTAPTYLFFGHLHRNVSGVWAGHPFAALKSSHVQFAFDPHATGLVRSGEPPGYGVVLIKPGADVVLNYVDTSA